MKISNTREHIEIFRDNLVHPIKCIFHVCYFEKLQKKNFKENEKPFKIHSENI